MPHSLREIVSFPNFDSSIKKDDYGQDNKDKRTAPSG